MSFGSAALAASLNLKTADLLRVLSSNMQNGGLLCEVPKPVGINGDAFLSPSNKHQQTNRKRCRSAETAHTDELLEDEEDGIPFKMSHNSSPTLEDGQLVQKPSFRGELKRPDLKGSFRCTICQKVFCHSSSLSRHRMQAHFKSYTCTLCSKEITSNETLRAHMLKQHQISRMFMCRCCNWAFPDKTSLHMHMQLQGKPDQRDSANVPVIGKSNQPAPSNAQNAVTPNNNKPANEPLFHANSLFSNNQPQMSGLFPQMPIDSILNLNTMQTPTAPQQQPPMSSIFKPPGLFPQLSMMRGDNVDLLSKLRQRLFLTSMWAQQQQNQQQKMVIPGQEKMLADFLENNNQLMVNESGIQNGVHGPVVPSPSDDQQKARQNLAQLMDMLQRNAQENNNNTMKTDLNLQEADSNNNNSADQMKEEENEDEYVELDENELNDEAEVESQLNFVTSTRNIESVQLDGNNDFLLQLNSLAKENSDLKTHLEEIRQQMHIFLEREQLTDDQKAFLLSLFAKLE